MIKTNKKLEILEYEEMFDELTPQLCGDENDKEFEEEIRNYEELIIRNNNEIKHKRYNSELYLKGKMIVLKI